ncbi:hypothetical protein EK904_002435 [Melospiza melodia maxima]|nr:hypothetical protein EK904_002435 [Melospiza melodia maxima]
MAKTQIEHNTNEKDRIDEDEVSVQTEPEQQTAVQQPQSPTLPPRRPSPAQEPYHVDQGHVEEHAGGDGEDPQGDVVGVLAHGRADQHADVGHHGRQQVVYDGLLHRHPRLQQHRKVTCGDSTALSAAASSADTPQQRALLLHGN